MTFTEAESNYMLSQLLGRLATMGPDATPQLRPLGFRLNPDGTIDLGGPQVGRTQRFRNVQSYPRVAFVVDDLTPDRPGEVKPGMGRGVEVRGQAEALTVEDPPSGYSPKAGPEIIRIYPERINSWHIDHNDPDGRTRNVRRSP